MQGRDPMASLSENDDNKRIADEIEKAVAAPSSIEEEMLLEAAELEEAEFGPTEETVT